MTDVRGEAFLKTVRDNAYGRDHALSRDPASFVADSAEDEQAGLAIETLDTHTIEVLSRQRPWRSNTKTRGWLLRRGLMTADIAGLALAFSLAQHFFSTTANDRVGPGFESII